MSETVTADRTPASDRPVPDYLRTGPKELLIGGEWCPAQSGETFATIDPTTEMPLIEVASAGAPDVDRAVVAARRAFEDRSWAALSPYERSRSLLAIADVIEQHAEELALLETLDNGAPLTVSTSFVAGAVETFRHYAGWPTKIYGDTAPSSPASFHYTLRQPVGVCGAIIPWNAPLSMAAWKIAPALAFGNTVVLKPAEQTPLTALRLGELLQLTDLPPGVVNIVTGFGKSAGEALIGHPDVDKIAFTGSGPVGRRILEVSTGNLKRVTLELGGKSPTIVFADADLEQAAGMAAAGFCLNSGQVCAAGTRVFVEDTVLEPFTELLTQIMQTFPVGDPLQPTTFMGPLNSKTQFDRVSSYLDIARADGGALLTTEADLPTQGYFHRPTVVRGLDNGSRVAREEIFGPVATVMPFRDLDDAVAQGNDTEFGLAAAVWTRDVSKAHRAASGLRAGTVWVNQWGALDPSVPYGGFKQSGVGREHGQSAVEMYTETKTVMVAL
ncbi:aldehyde dehydrogenase family protein [Actinomycetospora sp. C-140]